MAIKHLPAHPSLAQYRKQAKELLKSALSGDREAFDRFDAQHPISSSSVMPRLKLADAQLVVAREHGFASWPRFQQHVESLELRQSDAAIWIAAEQAVVAGDLAALEALLRDHPSLFRDQQPPAAPGGLRPDYKAGDARSILVHNHEFESWEQFSEFTQTLKQRDFDVARFEAAADAIPAGNLAVLDRLLSADPSLAHTRSRRKHHSTLLHYVGANGIEYWRQRTPKNIVAIASRLIQAGADVNAQADMYGGGSTALNLTATSVHPARAGVQQDLMALLIEAGARFDHVGNVNGCLANGRGQAAEWLADHGAPLDLEGAAGTGRTEVVKTFFDEQGALKPDTARDKMERGFEWACEYGHTEVAAYLLDRGISVDSMLRTHGGSGLHWAAYGAHMETARLLLDRGAQVEVRDRSFSGTPLDWALHAWGDPPPGTPPERYHQIVSLLVKAGARVDPAVLEREDVRADPEMFAALNDSS